MYYHQPKITDISMLNSSLIKVVNFINKVMNEGITLLSLSTGWGSGTTFSLSQPYTNFDEIKITWNGDGILKLKVSEIELNKEYTVYGVSNSASYTKFKFTSETVITRTKSSQTASILFEGIAKINL